jgi:hypothetical protein
MDHFVHFLEEYLQFGVLEHQWEFEMLPFLEERASGEAKEHKGEEREQKMQKSGSGGNGRRRLKRYSSEGSLSEGDSSSEVESLSEASGASCSEEERRREEGTEDNGGEQDVRMPKNLESMDFFFMEAALGRWHGKV